MPHATQTTLTTNSRFAEERSDEIVDEHVSDGQNSSGCIEKFKQDTNLVHSMKYLAAFGVMDASVLDGNLVQMWKPIVP